MKLSIRPLTAEQVRQMLGWEYEGPYAIYNMDGEDLAEAIQFFGDPENGYFAIVDANGEFAGFCNFGHDARVPGGIYNAKALDIGMGLRPDLTGQGMGTTYAAVVFDFASREYSHPLHRVTIAEFNRRAQRLCEHFGFRVSDRFAHARDGRTFVIMTRAIAANREEPPDSSGI